MFFSNRIGRIKPSPTISMNTKAKQLAQTGADVINIDLGEPDLPTPDYIKQGGIDAILNNKTKYTAMNGIVPLREEICKKMNSSFGTDYKINNVIITPGAKHAIFGAFMVTINHNDEVIIPAPYWVSYSDIVGIFGGKQIIVETKEENGFKITKEELLAHITPKTKWIMLNSPSNPTGAIYTEDELFALSDILLKNNIWLMTDDIYEYLTYDNKKFVNMLNVCPAMAKQTLIINGFSKNYCMTGWRIGYAVGSEELISNMVKLQSQSISSVCQISQEAAFIALKNHNQEIIDQMVSLYQKRRDIAFNMLNKILPLKPFMPNGAFYIFVNIKGLIGKKNISCDEDFVLYLLEKHYVSVVHGSAFGLSGYFRLSFATDESKLIEAINRITKAVEEIIKTDT